MSDDFTGRIVDICFQDLDAVMIWHRVRGGTHEDPQDIRLFFEVFVSGATTVTFDGHGWQAAKTVR